MILTCKVCREQADCVLNKKGDACVCKSCGKEFVLDNPMMMEAMRQNTNTEKTSGAEVLLNCPNCGQVEATVDNKNKVICGECQQEIQVTEYMRKIIMARAGVNAPIV